MKNVSFFFCFFFLFLTVAYVGEERPSGVMVSVRFVRVTGDRCASE